MVPLVGSSSEARITFATGRVKITSSGFWLVSALMMVAVRSASVTGSPKSQTKVMSSSSRATGERNCVRAKLDVAEVVDSTLKGLADLIAVYDDPDMPYLSEPRPMLLKSWGDYDHLARVLEWRGRAEDGE